jgi:hypothetical protein
MKKDLKLKKNYRQDIFFARKQKSLKERKSFVNK